MKKILIGLSILSSFLYSENYLEIINEINSKIENADKAEDKKTLTKEELELIKSNLSLNKIKKDFYLKSLNKIDKEIKYYNIMVEYKEKKDNLKKIDKTYFLKRDMIKNEILKIKNSIKLKNKYSFYKYNQKEYYSVDINSINSNIEFLKKQEELKKNLFELYNDLDKISIQDLKNKINRLKEETKFSLLKKIKIEVFNANSFNVNGFSINLKDNNIIIKRM